MSSSPALWLIATDTGGTFTDCFARLPDGSERRCKVLSSGRLRTLGLERVGVNGIRLRDDWGTDDGVFVGFECEGLGLVSGWDAAKRVLTVATSLPEEMNFPLQLDLFSGEAAPVVGARMLTNTPLGSKFPPMEFRLATTLATNALLEGKAAPVVFFVTEGFGDLLEIGDQRRPDLFALKHEKRRPLAKELVEVEARMDAAGNVLVELNKPRLEIAAQAMVAQGLTTAAVALAHSHVNSAHELAVREILLSAGFKTISLSSELSPLIRLLPRAETAVVNAALSPVMDAFVRQVSEPLGSAAEKFYCLTSASGLAEPAAFRAMDSLLSGPAGGVGGCAAVARAAGVKKILTLDMGGTSTDVARWEGDFLYQFEQRVGSASIMAPALRIETVAAGGGSICHVTNEGLAVGPQSAGANPGPACYGRGGPLTLTDVNLLLGRLDPERAAVPLWPEKSRERLEELKTKLASHGWPVPPDEELLRGLLEIAIERMAEAVRRISVREGCDPADYSLVAFGGAGPQHACAIAERLGIQEILVPRHAGLLSAFGAAQAIREEIVSTQLLRVWDDSIAEVMQEILTEMETRALNRLSGGRIRRRLAEMRLKGQDSTLLIDFVEPRELPEKFSTQYEALYQYPVPAHRKMEVVTLRVVAGVESSGQPVESFPEGQPEDLPSIIQDGFSTLILESGWQAVQGNQGTWRVCRALSAAPKRFFEMGEITPVAAELFRCRFAGLVDSMGALLQRTAISTNVKERLDFSCALLDEHGRLVMNAPHIPVHLGALGECVRRVTASLPPVDGQLLVTNDPAHAGSHLPDVTVICPVFAADGTLVAYTANRAHHAEIGGISPGSMPAFAKNLAEEGVLIPPTILAEGGMFHEDAITGILTGGNYPTRALADNLADLRAQAAAARQGREALIALCQAHGPETVRQHLRHLCSVAAGALQRKLASVNFTTASALETLDDGWPIQVKLTRNGTRLSIDFTGSGAVHPGSRNATTAVVRSAALYALRLWLAEDIPLNEGVLESVDLVIPTGFLNPTFSADSAQSPAVVAGNVETSQRIVDTLLKALQVQSCSQGTMNNVIFGNAGYGHYETLCGGSGAGSGYAGADGLHTHMTNTAITDAEILEYRYPVRIERFSIRPSSGGEGRWRGGNGIVRSYRFLEPTTISVLTEHRTQGPYALDGGSPGQPGKQTLVHPDGRSEILPGSTTRLVVPGSCLIMETPGGGGFGVVDP
jgi:5-oxoprolinase (ATP-hydrolysing)